MHLLCAYCVPAPVRVLGMPRGALHLLSLASLSRGQVDKECRCLSQEPGIGNDSGEGWAEGPQLILGLEGFFFSPAEKSMKPWR